MKENNSCLESPKVHNVSNDDSELLSQMFHTLMPFKVREILLVSSLYDAFIIEEEGLISEMVVGEYGQLHLSSPPRVTRVSSGKNALSKVERNKYDLVITMSKNIGMDPFEFGKKIKKIYPDLPVILLATETSDLNLIQQKEGKTGVDKAFFWNGDSSLFLAIIKYIEDKINVCFDTVTSNVQVIIMLEDSIRDYSMFLPIIYTEIVQQTERSISEDLNEMQRLVRRRGRPKILLAETFEEGMKVYEQYKDYLLGMISDVRFKQNGKDDPNAGYNFIQLVKKEKPYIPILMQSTDPENRKKAENIGAHFLDKTSPTLLQDFQHFLLDHLGFGDFIFLLPSKKISDETKNITENISHCATSEIGRASNMKEFEQSLQKVPLESIKFHANRNDFSNWLMARGEFKLAMELRPRKVSDFTSLDEMRKHLVDVFNETRRKKQLGVITDFSQQKFEFDSSFTRIGGESLGGKGRGIAFIRSLLARYNFEKKYKNITITVPSTVVIGTEEFDKFIAENDLHKFVNEENISDSEIAQAFLKGSLSKELKAKLAHLLQHFTSPLAIRSSGILEDSSNHPFAGLYATYMLPNKHKDDKVRLKQLCQAIKLVHASVFYKDARVYIQSTASKIEEEKMAVIVQELVGREYRGRFYPTFSGVIQSYNFYPVSHQTYEDGITSVAMGLGKTVVGGERVLRFSPRYPNIIPDFSTTESILENSQRNLYALNTAEKDFKLSEKDDSTLIKLNINDIENDGTLRFIASTYDRNDGMIRDGMDGQGSRLITFAGILKYDVFPLASLLQDIMDVGQKGMGRPVEIEFAVTFDEKHKNHAMFSILQIRPLVISHEHYEIAWDKNEENREDVFIRSDQALGNGVIDTIKDIVYVPPKSFDSSKTIEIADEVGIINKTLVTSSSPFILIGPGRWGTQDRWLGIPVRWSQISGVRVMVETALKKFNIKPSQGTHFFQNIISREIGYINTTFDSQESFIDWEWLENQKTQKELKFIRHIRLSNPLVIKLDGRYGRALVMKPET